MKCIYLVPLLAASSHAFVDCSKEVLTAVYKCADSLEPHDDHYVNTVPRIGSPGIHNAICYGDYPQCNDLQQLLGNPAANCDVSLAKGYYVNIGRDLLSPCANPMPPRTKDVELCTGTGLTLSEFSSKLYTDVHVGNENEHFVYNNTDRTLRAKSNGQCVEAIMTPWPGAVHTVPCNGNAEMQQWTIEKERVSALRGGLCLKAEPARRGAVVGLTSCNFGETSPAYFVECAAAKPKYVTVTSQGKRLSEYYTNLYANAPANNFNELFVWDQANKMLKAASNNQCLDAYKDANGKFKLHTYACDVNNSNQKWNFNPSTKTLEHATHVGQCLDADPTYADRHAQMWACTPNNPNQQWSIDTFTA
ncbi:hypothetical protein SDRG_11401 [Saprolegnia diclina VS20]|uniref:Ricin B lectin domain-containing protein n=1 Tax=Saprolegnia diclina (strain VS20) TaxID=1156394 RepID=T0RLP9_SAPDV|nr:hypothetical protein SDRG_11401 [Saprolegnia diclina VS20]EQC30922.1 hypothetical protein SDRG_11401 [Saprolegnia diclina VS20]|eukprot:XP_008615660.1 hypothetical protein SDRG_11401 [Saprolegnia diclina VS20]